VGTGRLVLLHGFTQNSRCWGPFLPALAHDREVVAVDLPGHGTNSAVRADLWQSAEIVADSYGPADYLGYSLGGRLLLHLAIARPEVVERAVLIGATAGIEDASERAERVRSDATLARELDEIGAAGAIAERAGLEEFLRRWLNGPLFKGLTDASSCLAERLSNDPAGLASSLRLCGTGMQEPLWEHLNRITAQTLLVAGGRDERFTRIAERIASFIGENATFGTVRDAFHACHLEKPYETAAIVDRFLSG
jgi:2-succinyl-6-hydroxy-2,4-cyclohexadiene-1-carboxylate synthase